MSGKLWQLYDEQGRPLAEQGASKEDALSKGLLHGVAHVWIWRKSNNSLEVLLQKRASNKRTWPNRYDISAAGHIDLGEEPITVALRETKEEIDLDVDEAGLKLTSVHRAYMVGDNFIENEFQWIYLLRLEGTASLVAREAEVESLKWKSIKEFKVEIESKIDQYVPHSNIYYQTVISAIESASTR